MRRFVYSSIAAAATFGVITYVNVENGDGSIGIVLRSSSAIAQSAPCTFPTMVSSTLEQTAWQLFVAANCPSSGNQVVWEHWVEQLQLYPASGVSGTVAANQAPRRLHGSPLATAVKARGVTSHSAKPMLTPNGECPNGLNGSPPNVTPSAIVCEEVHLNPDAAMFVSANGYQIRAGQTTAAQRGTDIEFPKPAIEVKVDWLPATDFILPFTCDAPPSGLHVEIIDGACYVMAGMHISSKLLDNWIWATFEPQSMLTNPFRCITFGPCNDAWGSSPATSNGGPNGFTTLSPALQSLMTQANLAPEFLNYRLDGVQIAFTESDGTTPTYLGNSIIEGENAGLTKNQASCISCHSMSVVKNDGSDAFNTFFIPSLQQPQVGPKFSVPANWIARDFVWSMAFACPDPTKTGEQVCN